MDVPSPYLQAIQDIPGTYPGQKYRELNFIAKKIASDNKNYGDAVGLRLNDVSEPLRPLVKLEIANIMQHYDGIVEGLKSDDSIVVNRAMAMSWFFKGTNKDIINVEYFEENILPFVSLDTRILLIKRLAMNLKSSGETKLGEAFYTHFANKYGRKEAETMLVACSEDFIYDTVIQNNMILSCRIVRILFITNPNLVIRYLKSFKKLGKKSDIGIDNTLDEYSDFLPRLIKKHSSEFVELLEMQNCTFGIKLSNKAAETFLKSNVDALLDKPQLYAKIMPLKVIAAKLTKPQYKSIFPKTFPKRWQDFRYELVEEFLQYYPEQERMALVMDSYKEAYNANFLDNTDAIDEHFLCMLPPLERAKQARIKLLKNPDWRDHRYNVTMAWRCYLPISESIPSIKNEISKCSNADDRSSLLKQLFYTCKVNDDNDALLDALKYFTTRHKNEMGYVVTDVLGDLASRIDLATLSEDHWEVINDCIQFLRVKDEIKNLKQILVAGVHFDLIHDLPIDDKIELLLDIYLRLKSWNPKWSILEKYPEYDRRCINAFMTMIPEKYPEGIWEVWKDRLVAIIERIVEAIYEFNTRNTKANCKIDKLSIKSYPWLMKVVKKIVQTPTPSDKWRQDNIISILKTHEKDLYKDWVVIVPEIVVAVDSGKALQRLHKDPKNILDNWEAYLKKVMDIAHSPCAHRFIRETRWHQEIPIKFLNKCLSDLNSENESSNAIEILGILMEGNEYAKIIEPLLPQDSKIDTTADKAKSKWGALVKITKGINLTNPPVPLRLILRLCQGDYLSLGLSSLTNASRRTSIKKIEPFVKSLVESRVSIRKHGIRIFRLVASTGELRSFLTDLWKTEKHRSIRAVIFEQINSVFIDEPNADTWEMMKSCIADFNVDDDINLTKLTQLGVIPIKYLGDYVKEIIAMLERLRTRGYPKKTVNHLISRLLMEIDKTVGNRLPDELCEQLMLKYFCNPTLHPDVSDAALNFILNGYLPYSEENLEVRLKPLCKHFEEVLKKHWDIAHPTYSSFYPINHIAHNFMTDLINLDGEREKFRGKIMESVLRSFLNVLRPECDFQSYVILTYGIAFKDTRKKDEIVNKICKLLPKLVEALSPEIIGYIDDAIKLWLNVLFDSEKVEEVMYDIVEKLCKIGTDHAYLLATKILFWCQSPAQFDDRRSRIITKLRKVKYPAVVSLIYFYANNISFPESIEGSKKNRALFYKC